MKPKSRQFNLVVQDLDNETLIYDLSVNKAYLLNPTSAFVWNACDGKTEAEEIRRTLAASTGRVVTPDVVWLAIEELKSFNLMKEAETPLAGFNSVNRRETIKRIGLASTIALPLITGLIAPKAAQAASGTCGLPCSSPTQCSVPCPSCNGLLYNCSAPGGTCAGPGACTVTGTCIGGFPIYTCSVPGGVCAGPGPCIVTGTCLSSGLGVCQ